MDGSVLTDYGCVGYANGHDCGDDDYCVVSMGIGAVACLRGLDECQTAYLLCAS